ncbi:restriction endonuclease subunit S [Pantoea brenneri]|uniref:restriction endonuclease subunit S n=1 Tax=Pantoea brenneri TaxID=472694 RepID=UPI002899BBEC|nr:restriction endonuclease subunit S [Pantoea brenneri]
MESEVQMVPIGELCDFLSGFAFKSEDLKGNSGIPVVKIKNVNNKVVTLEDMQFYPEDKLDSKVSRFLLSDGDVLIAMTGQGSVGRVGKLIKPKGTKFLLNQRVGKFIPKKTVACLDYIYYVISSEKYENILFNAASGSGQPNLSPAIIKSIQIPFVPLKDQIVVSQILTKLDEKITLNRQINHTLEQMAQALFKSWFVDFDPVVDNALDAGFFEQDLEFPDELLCRTEVRKVVRESSDFKPLSNDIRQLFPTAFEKCSEPSLGLGGWIPSGWVVSTTGDEFTVKGGSTPSTANPEFWEGGDIHWTSPKDLSGSKEKIMLDTERKITCAGLNKITSGLLPSETVLMSSRAPIGYLALTKIPVAINQGYIAIPATKRLSQEYVLYWLNSSIDEIKGIAGGTTFAEISKKTFKSISIVIPNTEAVDIFSVTTKSYLNKMTLSAVERAALEQLRDTLLPKLISGELRLSDSEADTADEVLA